MRYRYSAFNFLQYSHNWHPIARPWGRDKGCLLWFWYLIHFLPLLSLYRVWYRDKLDRVITALDCIIKHLNTILTYIVLNISGYHYVIWNMVPYRHHLNIRRNNLLNTLKYFNTAQHVRWQLIARVWRHTTTKLLVRKGPGNVLLPDDTKPLPNTDGVWEWKSTAKYLI